MHSFVLLIKFLDLVINFYESGLIGHSFLRKKNMGFNCFDQQKFKDAANLILFNTFVSFGGKIFQQIKGIPMGGNCGILFSGHFHCLLFIVSFHLCRSR